MVRWHTIQAATAWMERLERLKRLKQRIWSVWSDMNKVENIKLFRRHPISDEFKSMTLLPSRTVVYTQTNMEVKLIVAVCWHRHELSGPRTGLQSAWGTSGTGRELRHDGGWFSGVSGTCTVGTVQQWWWYQPWLTWKESGLRNTG